MSTNTTDSDVDEEHSATDNDERNDGEADDGVAEITIRRDSRGWKVVETTENVICDVSYVITLPPRQRITLKTEVGSPESDSDDTDDGNGGDGA